MTTPPRTASDPAPTYYKATRPDGTDFATGKVLYQVGETTPPITDRLIICERGYHVADTPAMTLVGGSWPCRLYRVEVIGDPGAGSWSEFHPHKGVYPSVRVIEELPAWKALGPNGEAVVALIERARTLTAEETLRLFAAWDAARYAARVAAWYAARALIVRDLISPEHFETLVAPWVAGVGRTWEAA